MGPSLLWTAIVLDTYIFQWAFSVLPYIFNLIHPFVPNSNLTVSPLEQERMILLYIPWYTWQGFLNHLIDILDWVYLFISGTHKIKVKGGE